MIKRAIEDIAFQARFGRQMRFIAGPRQVGKTTILKRFLEREKCADLYYNWDLRRVRDLYKREHYFFHSQALARGLHGGRVPVGFDEIHKFPKWKNILKDYFDEFEDRFLFIVTGSARLDLFRKSGDSLSGRYFLFRLLPVSLFELTGAALSTPEDKPASFIEASLHPSRQSELEALLRFGGYPEPLLKADEVFSSNWHEQYIDTLVREQLRDLTRIHELENVATLMSLIPERVGSPFSIYSTCQDMSVSFNAAKNYLRALTLAYVVFSVPPYFKSLARAVRKEAKVYFYDWTQVPQAAQRFENYVACELKHRAELWSLTTSHKFELFYLRMRDGQETDFLITRDGAPYLLVEAKESDRTVAPQHLLHARKLGGIPVLQVLCQPDVVRAEKDRFYVVSASRFF